MVMSSTVIVVLRRTRSGLQFARKVPSAVVGVTARTLLHVLWAAMLLVGVLLPTPCQGQVCGNQGNGNNIIYVPSKAGSTRVILPAGLDVAKREAVISWDTSNVKDMGYCMQVQGCLTVLTPGLECATCRCRVVLQGE